MKQVLPFVFWMLISSCTEMVNNHVSFQIGEIENKENCEELLKEVIIPELSIYEGKEARYIRKTDTISECILKRDVNGNFKTALSHPFDFELSDTVIFFFNQKLNNLTFTLNGKNDERFADMLHSNIVLDTMNIANGEIIMTGSFEYKTRYTISEIEKDYYYPIEGCIRCFSSISESFQRTKN